VLIVVWVALLIVVCVAVLSAVRRPMKQQHRMREGFDPLSLYPLVKSLTRWWCPGMSSNWMK